MFLYLLRLLLQGTPVVILPNISLKYFNVRMGIAYSSSGAGLRPLVFFWGGGEVCSFEFCCVHERLSLVSVVVCYVESSATGRSLVQRSHTECGVSECDS